MMSSDICKIRTTIENVRTNLTPETDKGIVFVQ